jgi:hypothetical protein
MRKEVFGHDHQFLERAEPLTFEEIERVVRIFMYLGLRKSVSRHQAHPHRPLLPDHDRQDRATAQDDGQGVLVR